MFHWIPFDQSKLWATTGIKPLEFRHWINDDDNHTLALLIEKHGKDPDAVSRELMAPWKGKVSAAQLAELSRRTGELMTQGHLAQHVFFHYFHDPILAIDSAWIFKTPPGDYHRARLEGYSPSEIAIRAGVPVKQAVRRAMAVMRRTQDEAVRSGQTSRSQAEAFLRQQNVWINFWLTQKLYAHRRSSYPAGNAPAGGSRLRQACTYLAGSKHPAGPHDDTPVSPAAKELGVLPFKQSIAAHDPARPAMAGLLCALVHEHGRLGIDPRQVAELQDYVRTRGLPVRKAKPAFSR